MSYWYPDFADQVLHGLYVRMQPSLSKFVEGAGYLSDWDIVLMQTAYNIEPAFLCPKLLIERVPYARPESFAERMKAATQHGWLQEGQKGFTLTRSGREIVVGLYELGDRLLAKIKALPPAEMGRLLYLFDELISKIKGLPEPTQKPAFELSLLFDRGASTPAIVRVRQRTLVLLAFRDDAHMAAWRLREPDGQLWETFTLIWRGQAGNAAELAEQLPHRNYSKSDYAEALEALSARGWIVMRSGRFIPQEQAARMRQEVETATDRIFDAAFAGLPPVEMSEFYHLMGKFAAAVNPERDNRYKATVQPTSVSSVCLDKKTIQAHSC